MPPENDRRTRKEAPPQPPAGFRLTDKEFEKIRTLVKAKTGISLGLHKRDLVVSRLARRLRHLGLSTFTEYLEILEEDGDGGELVNMINQITTNKTDFFREPHHFQHLGEVVLPRIFEAGEKTGERRLRAWSAGCSSGEEPYSIAITLLEFFKDKPGWDVKLLATDLDTNMLTRASRGEYEESQVEPVPKALLSRYFERRRAADGATYAVRQNLRELITYRKFNLMNKTYPFKVALDFVFCRNVLIYFEMNDKVDILTRFHGVMKPGAPLFVGHSESLMMVKDFFSYVATTVYHKV